VKEAFGFGGSFKGGDFRGPGGFMTQFVFVTGRGGVEPSQGMRGGDLGRVAEIRAAYSVSILKLDFRTSTLDPGTMSPYQHGEVFVTRTRGDDLDLGPLTSASRQPPCHAATSVTTGFDLPGGDQQERRGIYNGRHGPGDPPHHPRDPRAHPTRVAGDSGLTW